MITQNRRGRALLGAATVSMSLSLLLAGCASGQAPGGTTAPAVNEGTNFVVLTPNENPTLRKQLDALATGACSAANTALPLQHETVAQADVVTKVTLLASQDSLPSHFVAGTAQVRPAGDLGKAGVLVDYKAKLTELGVWDNVLPAAASTVTSVYGGMVSLPYQYNLEGIWYNKKIFAANGIAEPKTWDELLAASAKLKSAGVIPITQGGAQGWPLTRILGMYIFRSLGADAMAQVRDGKAKLTDPGYVAAAEAFAKLGSEGYFGEGVVSRATDVAQTQFLTGKAGMFYQGSWFLSNINNAEQNQIGAENIGFMPFPDVSGGKGSSKQWPANAGAAMAMSIKTYGPKTGAWLKCIAQNFGSEALSGTGAISGFKLNKEVTNVPATTKMVQTVASGATETVLWFEALMDSKSNALASSNVGLLATGQMTPADYMAKLQASIDANR